jgi:hypothetical protein
VEVLRIGMAHPVQPLERAEDITMYFPQMEVKVTPVASCLKVIFNLIRVLILLCLF